KRHFRIALAQLFANGGRKRKRNDQRADGKREVLARALFIRKIDLAAKLPGKGMMVDVLDHADDFRPTLLEASSVVHVFGFNSLADRGLVGPRGMRDNLI